MVYDKIVAILMEQLDIANEDSISMDSLLVEDLGADSLDSIDIVMSVEDEFKIEVIYNCIIICNTSSYKVVC